MTASNPGREALLKAADAWQQGEWANAPRRDDRVEERLANGQYVADWLRARAEREDPFFEVLDPWTCSECETHNRAEAFQCANCGHPAPQHPK
jgi:hypothetical protein